jgi:hypothetical protein
MFFSFSLTLSPTHSFSVSHKHSHILPLIHCSVSNCVHQFVHLSFPIFSFVCVSLCVSESVSLCPYLSFSLYLSLFLSLRFSISLSHPVVIALAALLA